MFIFSSHEVPEIIRDLPLLFRKPCPDIVLVRCRALNRLSPSSVGTFELAADLTNRTEAVVRRTAAPCAPCAARQVADRCAQLGPGR